jgi:hypothetical protein
MDLATLVDALSSVLIAIAIGLLWRARAQFMNLKPIIPALFFVLLGRISDIILEHAAGSSGPTSVSAGGELERGVAIAGNFTDALGFSLLIYGFLRIIREHRKELEHIQKLETLLPLCAHCKKYRSPENQWLPIEKYLTEHGTPDLSHSICPTCLEELYGDILERRRMKGKGDIPSPLPPESPSPS